MKNSTSNIIYGSVCIALSLLLLFWVIPKYTSKSMVAGDISSRAIPSAMIVVVLISGIALVVQGFIERMRSDNHPPIQAGPAVWKPFSVLGVLLLFILAINYIGFYASTAVFLPAMLKWYNRQMKWPVILLGTAALLLFVFVLFEKGLYVRMPRGFLL